METVSKQGGMSSLGTEKRKSSASIQDETTSLLKRSRCDSIPEESYSHTSQYGCISNVHAEPSGDGNTFNCNDLLSSNEMDLGPEEKLKRQIKYFFMDPLEKWKTKGKIPWKLLLQLVKIIVVTSQLVVFGNDGYIYELQKQNTGSSFRHMFLKDWLPIREIVSYPPSTGPYAVYTKPEFFDNANHVIKMYSNITVIALGSYKYNNDEGNMTSVKFCRSEFYKVFAEKSELIFDRRIRYICREIPPLYPAGDKRWESFSLESFLNNINDTIKFERLISASLTFSLRTIFLKNMADIKLPDCYNIYVKVNYDNKEHDGQILVSLDTTTLKFHCKLNGTYDNGQSEESYAFRQILNTFIICICLLSLLLCIRCLCKGYVLCKNTDEHFRKEYQQPLTAPEKLEFVDGWYCMMIINDLLIIFGSIFKACIEKQTVESDHYVTCAILLGVGNLLVWAGVLRYLGFFRKYNILILTLKKALPNVIRFMLCCVLLYGGFCFCGWIVLGPYHIKFRSLSTTSECLFALMNGDDLFATFAIIDTDSVLVWWFSRIYLYLFISMFIYVVISLFISVIMDSYETVKDYYRHGSTPTRIEALVSDCTEDSCSTFYRLQKSRRPSLWARLAKRCQRKSYS